MYISFCVKKKHDILRSGLKLKVDLTDALTSFRRFKYVFVTDIERIYRQMFVGTSRRLESAMTSMA